MTSKPQLPKCPYCGRTGGMVELTYVLFEYPIVEIDPEIGEPVDYDTGKMCEETYGAPTYFCKLCETEHTLSEFIEVNKLK